MQTLWIGVRDGEVLCHGAHAHELVERMRKGTLLAIGDGMHLQAVRAMDGSILGFGAIVRQSEDDTMRVDTQALVLPRVRATRALRSRGIWGDHGLTTYVEDASGNVWP